MSVITTALIGAAAVLAFDTLGSLASLRFAFAYSQLTVGSFLIYVVVGFAACADGPIGLAPAAGGIVAFVEATIGWAISWWIGPGRLPPEQASPGRLAKTVLIVTGTGMVMGFAGGLLRIVL